MADDVNKAGGRYNQIGAAASMDEIFSRVRQSTEVNSVAAQRLRLEGRDVKSKIKNLRDISDVLQEGYARRPTADLKAAIAQNRDEYAEALERRQFIAQRFEQEVEIARTRGYNTLTSQIGQFTGSRAQTSRINESFSSSATMDIAARSIASTSYSDFERQAAAAARSAREAAMGLREAAHAGAPESDLRKLGLTLTEQENRIGVARRGMQLARQMGLDPQSQFMDINSAANRASTRLETEGLRRAAAAGELPSLKELNTEILATAKQLKELQDGFATSGKTLEEFNKEAGAVADKLTKLEQQEKAVAAAGGGGSIFRNIVAAGGAISAGVNFGQQAFINQPIQALNNRAQIAAQQNQQYATLRAALGGDMAALSLIGTGAFQNAADFASGKKTTQQVIQGLGAAATAIDAGARAGLEVAEGASLGKMGGGTLSSTGRAMIIGAEGAFNTATQISDLAQGVTSGQTNINAYVSALEAQRQILAVPSAFRQSYFDYGRGMTEATRFAGAGREGMLSTLMGNDFLNQMQGLRIDPNRAAAMVGQGLAGQGSAFSLNQLTTARNLERAGFGSMEESMRRFGALAGAGSANSEASFAKLFEDAVARGMDSSKAVSMMVDATASLADSSSAGRLGIDATGGISALIGRAIGDRGGRSEVAAMNAAQNAIGVTSGMLTDNSVTFTNMVRNTRLRQMGMAPLEAAKAIELNSQDLSVLQGGGASAQQLVMQRGLVSLLNKDGSINQGQVNKFLNIQGQFLDVGGAGGVGMTLDPQTAAAVTAFRKRRLSGTSDLELLKENPAVFGAMMQTIDGGGASSNIAGSFLGAVDKARTGNGGKIMNGTAPIGPQTAGGESMSTGGAVQGIKEIQAGRKDLESLDKVAKVLGAIEKGVTPETMEKFAGAASSAASNMEISATNFKQLSEQAGILNTEFSKLSKTLEALNTSAANLGGFSTKGNKALTQEQIEAGVNKAKQRVDGKTQ